MKKLWLIPVAFSLILGVVACSDDTNTTPGKEAGVGTEAGMNKEAGTPTEAGNKEAGPSTGQCTNAADQALLDTPAKSDAVKAAAQKCGIGCLADADKKKCATDCVIKDTKLSTGCSGCYAEIILCSVPCAAQCATDPNSKACRDCQDKQGCYPAFYKCSGLTPPATPDGGSADAAASDGGA